MILTHKISLSLDHRGDRPCVDAVQGDTARAVEISLLDCGAAWLVPDGTTAVVRYRRVRSGAGGIYDTMPDGTAAYAVRESGVTVLLAPQVLAVAGPVELQVTLIKDGAELTCFGFLVSVEGNLTDMDPDEESYVNLSALIQQQIHAAMGGYVPSGGAGIYVGPEAPASEGMVLWVDTDDIEEPSQSGGASGDTPGGGCQCPSWDWLQPHTIEITEAVWSVSVGLGSEGELPALREIKIYITTPTRINTTSIMIQLKDSDGAELFKINHTSIFVASKASKFYGYLDCDGTYISGYVNNDWDFIPLKAMQRSAFDPAGTKNLIISAPNEPFEAGTVIKIWGR